MVFNFVDSALILDDTPSEVKGLIDVLEQNGVATSFYEPDKIPCNNLKNRKIIFLDIYIDPTTTELKGQISKIRTILRDKIGNNFGTYGIVLWSAHSDEVKDLIDKIQLDKNKNLYTLPLFIVGLNKAEYIRKGNYSSLLADLNDALQNDLSAHFFLEWHNSIKKAQDKVLSNFYSLLPNYHTSGGDFKFLLKNLAQNYAGIPNEKLKEYPLTTDSFKSFDEILHGELLNCEKTQKDILGNISSCNFSDKTLLPQIYAQINTSILIDSNNINQKVIIPGNVYRINSEPNVYISDKAPSNAQKILVELTPPCDFAQKDKRVYARIVGGFIVDAETNIKQQIQNLKCTKESFYTEIWPILIPGDDNPKLMILDFRYFGHVEDNLLKVETYYPILFRLKPKLFADILQKFSSHSARLGLSVMHI